MRTMRGWSWLSAGPVGVVVVATLVFATVLAHGARARPAAHAAEVSYLEGKAQRTASGSAVAAPLRLADQLAQGDLISTERGSRLELRLDDKSIIRLGPSAQIALTEAQFAGGEGQRKLTVKLFFGNLWAKVTSLVGGDQRFAIETENAVAGVRGTTFQVDALPDRSMHLRVHDGAVACSSVPAAAKSPAGTLRHEVPGPEEVPRKQWEKLVGAQMEMTVSAQGAASQPAAFDPAAVAADPWVKWNQERDAK